ncbi:Bacillibactin exporter [Paenibacillus plantiphilus]|uniref:Bacillibactin exporter n=1 Tax=Paenibacillus plantiphilus TaxID=2905650 RepID=A0ABN8GF86_9BACL|nr:MFS transporter [Paenibacillus plantiphilus]CAH1203798.1 Bacillibactin exporter [Paenibacillus plantiphilus]
MKEKKKLDLAALSSIPLIMTLANSMLIPILPLMQRELNISDLQTSLIITVYAAVSIVCIPIAGYLSDRFGRKRIIVISLIIVAVGGLISGLAAWLMKEHGSYYVILLGRFIQGIGAAGAFPIVLPLVGDMFDSKEEVSKGLGMVETSNTFGKVLSPVLGSSLALVFWFLPLAVIPFISILSILAVLFFVKTPGSSDSTAEEESNTENRFRSFIHNTALLLAEKGHWLYAIFSIGCLAMFIMFGFLYYLSSVLEHHYHIDGIKKGLLLAIPLSAICISSYITGKIVGENKLRMKVFSVIGLFVLTAAMLTCGIANTKSMWFLISLMFVSGGGIGLVLPSLDALITEGIEKKQRGTITSLYSSARFIGVALGPLIASVMLKNEAWLFYLFAGSALLCSILALFTIKPTSSSKVPSRKTSQKKGAVE